LKFGADGFVRKPFYANVLLEEIKRASGVDYIYEKENKEEQIKPSKEIIHNIPLEIRKLIYNAAIIGDIEKLIQMADELRKIDKKKSDELEDLINNFELDKIKELYNILQEEEKSNERNR